MQSLILVAAYDAPDLEQRRVVEVALVSRQHLQVGVTWNHCSLSFLASWTDFWTLGKSCGGSCSVERDPLRGEIVRGIELKLIA